MVSPEFFVSRVTFPIGATALVLVFGGLTFFFGKLIDEILVENQGSRDRQVLGALFIFNKILLPFVIVAFYFNQSFVPVIRLDAISSVVGVFLSASVFSAQSKLVNFEKFELYRTERFENGVIERFTDLPQLIQDEFLKRWGDPVEFIQDGVNGASWLLLNGKITYIMKFVFAFFLANAFLSENILAIAFSGIFALSGYSLLAKSYAFMKSDYVWTVVETKDGETFRGRILSSGDKITLWNEEEKIEINSDEIAVKRQSRWTDEKLGAEEGE